MNTLQVAISPGGQDALDQETPVPMLPNPVGAPYPAGAAVTRPSILLVMRHQAELLLYGDLLESDGFATIRTGSAAVARSVLAHRETGLLLVDLDDSPAEADELVRLAQHNPIQPIPVIGLTATAAHSFGPLNGSPTCRLLHLPASIEQIKLAVRQALPSQVLPNPALSADHHARQTRPLLHPVRRSGSLG